MVKNVPAQDTVVFRDEEILTSEDTVEKNHVQSYGRRKAFGSIETHQLVTLAGDKRDSKRLNDLTR